MLIRENTLRSHWLPLLLGGGLWLMLCWPMLRGVSLPGFRDSAYLYYPLFAWLDAEWSKGEVPLWNPFCNFGMSNVGDNTTSLFYPGKVVFFARFLDFPTRYGIYISLHLLLAGVGAFWFSRVLNASIPGSFLAGLSYACSGVVLTQATNVIFLVSAAWLPFALSSVWQMIWPERDQSALRWSLVSSICCAMMILGGDPQMVYHVGLIAAATVVCKTLGTLRRSRPSLPGNLLRTQSNRTSFAQPMIALVSMVIVTSLLALVQVVPAYQWSQLSERASSDRPNLMRWMLGSSTEDSRSIPESGDSLKRLIEPLQANSVSFANYEFSLPPWSLLELFFPNAGGRLFPTHQRWSDLLPSPQGPDRIWFPGIYMGWVTAWLGLANLRLAGSGRRVWLSRIGLFFLLGAFGWYGLCWLLPIPGCGSQVGGLYWWMNLVLPGYDSFRYPAKLFVPVSLCICVLAGLRLNGRRPDRIAPQRSLVGWAFLIATVGALVFVLNDGCAPIFEKVVPDPLFGPFDLDGARLSLIQTLLQGLCLASCLAILCRCCETRPGMVVPADGRSGWKSSFFCWALVVATTVDVVLANRWILALVPSSTFTNPSSAAILKELDPVSEFASTQARSTNVPLTIYRAREGFVPDHWKHSSSALRLSEILSWQRTSLYPKHHLEHQIRLLGSFGSIQPRVYENWLQGFEQGDHLDSMHLPGRSPIRDLSDGELSETPMKSLRFSVWNREAKLVFLRSINAAQSDGEAPSAPSGASLEVIQFSANTVALKLKCLEDCQLVYSCLFDGNWEAQILSESTGLAETRALVEFEPGYQGLELKAGEYDIQLNYNPRAFWVSVWVSLIAWLLVIPAGLFPKSWIGKR